MTTSIAPRQCRSQVGVARGDITPPVGIYHRMWGAATHDRSTGVHRPLTATVLALEPMNSHQSTETRYLVAIDHCLLWTDEMQNLLDRVASIAGVGQDAITVLFSHTHAAGLMGMERCDLPGGEMIPQYLDDVAATVAQLVSTATSNLQPATISFGQTHCSLAANRDFFDEECNAFTCGFNPTGVADSTVVVGNVVSNAGVSLATIVNYACHPTTLAWDNTLISPDYVGAMREVIEQAIEAPCFFFQGASGDIGPREGFVGDVAVADRNGRQLGYAVLSAMEGLPIVNREFTYAGPVVSGATIGTWQYRPATDERLQAWAEWKSVEVEVELELREDLPRRDDLLEQQRRWQDEEQKAADAGDAKQARQARAMIERATRRLVRVKHLPESRTFNYNTRVICVGDVIWILLNGEHYNVLQRELRERFPHRTLVIGTLANGSDVWYLPDEDSYGKGLYQEEASVLARGSLEKLIDALTSSIQQLIA